MAKRKNQNALPKLMAVLLLILALVAFMVGISSCNKEDPSTEAIATDPEQSENISTSPDESTPDETVPETIPETVPEETEPPVVVPKYYNPLTGLECSEEMSLRRPIGIMVNNINISLPQEGITYGDVMYECLAEGGITRLFMLVQDYENLPNVGSVRSTRDYYLDLAQNHDALFFHAGGSDKAYSEIETRKIDNFDGVRMNIPNTFFRDPWRQSQMGYEHTLVITGEGMVNAIKYRNSRTELKEDFKNPFNFTSENKAPDGEDAKCVYIPFSAANSPYHKYNASTNTYKRWQYGDEHVDKDGDQLEFTNIIILFCHHTGPLDDKLRIEITTTGEGDGYYVSGGKYVPIKYSKANEDAQVILMNEDGSPLEINRGKTYIAIYNSAAKANINMNYEA